MTTAVVEEDAAMEITPAEAKELRRVFERLCDFSQVQSALKEIAARRDRLAALQRGDNTAPGSSGKPGILVLSDVQVRLEAEALTAEMKHLEEEVARLQANPNKRIRAIDVLENMKYLGKACGKKEVADMIWEVDEDLDGCVDWAEFRLMFHRNINDKTGLEPSKLHNMIQFMIYDVDSSGRVSVDETMNMLYARYGRVRMEAKLKELFGEEMRETGTQGGEINFLQYLEAVERTQLQTFLNSTAGRAQLAKKKAAH
ncbi:unnamed protein product [Phaeothamnion confervicola]